MREGGTPPFFKGSFADWLHPRQRCSSQNPNSGTQLSRCTPVTLRSRESPWLPIGRKAR